MKNTNINEMVKSYQEGNKEIFEKILKDNKNLIYSISRKYVTIEKEDAFQIGSIELLKAVETFNPNKGKFSVYAYRMIDNEFQTIIKKKRIDTTSYDMTCSEDEKLTILDTIADTTNLEVEYLEKEFRDNRIKNIVKGYAKKNKKKEKAIILTLTGCYTQEEIGEMLGVTHGYVSRIFKGFQQYAQENKEKILNS
jgi:RNA polymerase sporulation-specific sigma factor